MSIRRLQLLTRFTSVRGRLTLCNVSVLTIALTLVGIQIRYSVTANIMSSIDRELNAITRHTARGYTRRWPRNQATGPNLLQPNALTAEINELDASIGINTQQQSPVPSVATPPAVRRRGELIPNAPATRVMIDGPRSINNLPPFDLASFSKAENENSDIYSTVNSAGKPFRIMTHMVRSIDHHKIVVQSSFPLAEMTRALHSLDITLLTTIPLVLLIAGMGGALLTDRAMRPVRQIIKTTEQIGARDLSRRLPVGTDDEFAQLSTTFNAMLARLESSFNQQRRFTADASHELKSPLTVIKANTGLALKTTRTPDEYIRRLEAIDKASNHMRVLVDDLLLLARADEGRLAINREAMCLQTLLIEAVEATSRPECAAVSFEMSEEPIMLEGNQHEIMRVCCNLLDNALRHTPSSGTVTVRLKDEGIAVCVTIEDTGDGISTEHIAHLGERFYRVDSSRSRAHGGSGLGLAICKSIVEAHHGDLKFRSKAGVGTLVTITLPTVYAGTI